MAKFHLSGVRAAALALGGVLALSACPAQPARDRPVVESAEASGERADARSSESAAALPRAPIDASATSEAAVDAAAPPVALAPDDPMAPHTQTLNDLLALLAHAETDGGAPAMWARLRPYVGLVPGRFNQGNRALSHHRIGQRECLEGLRGIVLQTEAQKTACHGKENMVPVHRRGAAAKSCVDVFEFPNQACELPVVWGTPSEAERVCELSGKRLCTQEEWNVACAGDPAGGPDRVYAYGDSLDLDICNTNKSQELTPGGLRICDTRAAASAWQTCATDTEPAGAFPRCRSRFGVFDQHGNVAEMMTRREDDTVYTQLKGSAFFYVDVARAPNEPQKPGAKETYPDQCSFDPRWHVEHLEGSLHSNYHLGFRCCLSI